MKLHPEMAHLAGAPRAQLDDVPAARAALVDAFAGLAAMPAPPSITIREQLITRGGGNPDLRVRIYKPRAPGPLPALVYFHGGAFTMGSLEISHPRCMTIADGAKCVVISVDYRQAPEHPFPTPVEDCYDGLIWASQASHELGIDDRIAIGGESAGGALAAAVALMARDRNGPVAKLQMLFYPVLDDRLTSRSMNEFGTMWDKGLSEASWRHYVSEGTAVSAYAAPARAKDLSRLPAAFILVGGMDPLRDEGVSYALRLQEADVPVELHIIAGVPHGFDLVAPTAVPTTRAVRLMIEAIDEFLVRR